MKDPSRHLAPHLNQAPVQETPARRVRRKRSVLQDFFGLPAPSDSGIRLMLRLAAGLVFITFGQMKFFDSILLGTRAVSLPPGPEGFAQYLSAVGIPFPLLSAYLVCLVEMICGLGLLLSAFLPAPALFTRLAAIPLAGDMMVATLTVGLRNVLGNPVRLEGISVTAQAWRLPLELALLLVSLLFLWRPLSRREAGPANSPVTSDPTRYAATS